MSDTKHCAEVRTPLWNDAQSLAKTLLIAVAFTVAMW